MSQSKDKRKFERHRSSVVKKCLIKMMQAPGTQNLDNGSTPRQSYAIHGRSHEELCVSKMDESRSSSERRCILAEFLGEALMGYPLWSETKEVKTGVSDSSLSQARSLLALASTSTSKNNILKCGKVQGLGGKISDKPKVPLSLPLTLVAHSLPSLRLVLERFCRGGCF